MAKSCSFWDSKPGSYKWGYLLNVIDLVCNRRFVIGKHPLGTLSIKFTVQKKPETVKIDAWDINGARFTVNLSGLPARVFQHEFDLLLAGYLLMEQGILFFHRMSDQVLDSIRTELQALEMKYEKKTGLPSSEKIKTRKRKKVATGFGKPKALVQPSTQ